MTSVHSMAKEEALLEGACRTSCHMTSLFRWITEILGACVPARQCGLCGPGFTKPAILVHLAAQLRFIAVVCPFDTLFMSAVLPHCLMLLTRHSSMLPRWVDSLNVLSADRLAGRWLGWCQGKPSFWTNRATRWTLLQAMIMPSFFAWWSSWMSTSTKTVSECQDHSNTCYHNTFHLNS